MKKFTFLLFILIFPGFNLFAYNINGYAIDDESEDPLPGLEITLNTEGGLIKTTTTLSDGSFSFSNVPDGSHELEFHYYEPVIINGIYYLRTLYGDPIVVNGGDVNDVLFNITPHYPVYHVSGTLYDANTNEPLINQNLNLRLDFFSHSGFFFAWSENDGSYSFDDLVPDWSYFFDVFQNEYYFGDQIELTIDTTGSNEIVIDFYLQPKEGVSVTGKLYDIETNLPILQANRTVRITAINSMWAETNEEGIFTFVNVEPGYYANITVTSEDTSYINCDQSTINDFIVPEQGLSGVLLYQKKFETVHVITVDDQYFVPGEIKTLKFSLTYDNSIYGEIWGVELHLPPELTALGTTDFLKYGNNNLVFEREWSCSYPDRLVWEGYHSVFGFGNVGNLDGLNESVYANVEFQFDDNPNIINTEIFYEVFYSYACVWQPFSFGTIVLENENNIVGITDQLNSGNHISVYPNPANENATIKLTLENNAMGTIGIYDMTGQIIQAPESGYFSKGINKIEINTTELSEGLYYYNYTDESKMLSGKLVISR